jgi:nucleoside transporter
MQTRLKIQLSAFMFLQYFIWGSWYASMGGYLTTVLNFGGQQVGAAYGAFAIGSMISPFFVGLIADRYFASEKLLGALGLLGGGVICLLPSMQEFEAFYPTLILYCALFAPTLALGNSLSLHHLQDAKRDFPLVKTLSAIGWIVGGVTVSLLHADRSAVQFYVAGAASIAFGLFALTLPHTPPRKVGKDVSIGEVLGLDALALLSKPSFSIFIACMFLICIPLYFYFVNMSIYLGELQWQNPTGWMTLAQVSDVIFLVLLPLMLRTLGYKKTIAIGIIAWSARYVLLSYSSDSPLSDTHYALVFGAILLHGVCYDFLFIAGQLYVDGEANERIRGAAQGFVAFILWGIGAFVGTMLAGRVMDFHKLSRHVGTIEHDWRSIWMTPAIAAAAVLGLFLIFFREPREEPAETTIAGDEREGLEEGPP